MHEVAFSHFMHRRAKTFLADLNAAGTGAQVHRRAAATDFALQLARAQLPLYGDLAATVDVP
jgi:hypothetical protein